MTSHNLRVTEYGPCQVIWLYRCDIRTGGAENTETMFSTKEILVAIVEATRALGYSKLRSNQDRVVAQL